MRMNQNHEHGSYMNYEDDVANTIRAGTRAAGVPGAHGFRDLGEYKGENPVNKDPKTKEVDEEVDEQVEDKDAEAKEAEGDEPGAGGPGGLESAPGDTKVYTGPEDEIGSGRKFEDGKWSEVPSAPGSKDPFVKPEDPYESAADDKVYGQGAFRDPFASSSRGLATQVNKWEKHLHLPRVHPGSKNMTSVILQPGDITIDLPPAVIHDKRTMTYCNLNPDGTYLCPNPHQRDKIERHLRVRDEMRAAIFFLLAGFVIIGQNYIKWFSGSGAHSRSINQAIYTNLIKQLFVIMAIYAFVSVFSTWGVIRDIHLFIFGEPPKRLDVKKHMIGDMREGKVITETGVLINDCLLTLAGVVPAFLIAAQTLVMAMNRRLKQWREWEIGGLSESAFVNDIFNVEKTGGKFKDRIQFFIAKRLFTTPRNISQKQPAIFKGLSKPRTDFMLYMYLREAMSQIGEQIIAFPKLGLTLAALLCLLSADILEFNLYAKPVVVLQSMIGIALISILVIFGMEMVSQSIFEKTVPNPRYLKWDIDNEENFEDEAPSELVPAWKSAERQTGDPQDRVLDWLWGTSMPTRQEVLWPFWKNGPAFVQSVCQVAMFFLIMNLGTCFALIMMNPGEFLRTSEGTGYFSLLLLVSWFAFAYTIPNFIATHAMASNVDLMTNTLHLESACLAMKRYHGDSKVQDLVFAIGIHTVYRQIRLDPVNNKISLAATPKILDEKVEEMIAEFWEKGITDPYKGAEDGEADGLLGQMGFIRLGQDVREWKQSFQFRESGYLMQDEFMCLLIARSMALHDELAEKDVYIVLKDMADEKTGYVTLEQLSEVFQSVGWTVEESDQHADDLHNQLTQVYDFGEGRTRLDGTVEPMPADCIPFKFLAQHIIKEQNQRGI